MAFSSLPILSSQLWGPFSFDKKMHCHTTRVCRMHRVDCRRNGTIGWAPTVSWQTCSSAFTSDCSWGTMELDNWSPVWRRAGIDPGFRDGDAYQARELLQHRSLLCIRSKRSWRQTSEFQDVLQDARNENTSRCDAEWEKPPPPSHTHCDSWDMLASCPCKGHEIVKIHCPSMLRLKENFFHSFSLHSHVQTHTACNTFGTYYFCRLKEVAWRASSFFTS